jgi:hypothetical protein
MTRSEMQARIRALKEELETRHKYGAVKMASEDGRPVPVEQLQNELFNLIYRVSKLHD